MSIQWVTLRDRPHYVSVSSDGYYAVAKEFRGDFMAHHIEALWAKPIEIGRADTIGEAQELCEQHRERTSAPA